MEKDKYVEWLNQKAKELLNKHDLALYDIRELLILSAAESCTVANEFFLDNVEQPMVMEALLSTIADEDAFNSGDARIQAAFFLSRMNITLLRQYETSLLRAYDCENPDSPGAGGDLGGLIAFAFSLIGSARGKSKIETDLQGNRCGDYWLEEALKNYAQQPNARDRQ